MKKKRLFISIATICLCLCAIMFGVYSAKQASLNVSGVVGFTAHNCDVYVYASLSGAMDKDTLTEKKVESFGSEDGYINVHDTTKKWDIGTVYFDDINLKNDEKLANDIVITVKMYNKSAFIVKGTFNTSAIANENITVTPSVASIKLPANQTGYVDGQVMEITISLTKTNLSELNFADISLINFEKYVPSFTVTNANNEITTYTFAENQTWQDWITSKNNTAGSSKDNGFVVSDLYLPLVSYDTYFMAYISNGTQYCIKDASGTPQCANTVITESQNYTFAEANMIVRDSDLEFWQTFLANPSNFDYSDDIKYDSISVEFSGEIDLKYWIARIWAFNLLYSNDAGYVVRSREFFSQPATTQPLSIPWHVNYAILNSLNKYPPELAKKNQNHLHSDFGFDLTGKSSSENSVTINYEDTSGFGKVGKSGLITITYKMTETA